MRAFYFASPGQNVDSGSRVVGDLAVPAGKYVVFAKADIGTNATGGYPQAGGALRLMFAGHADVAYAAIKPDSGDNIENVSLILAAETEGQAHARLEFINPYPPRVAVNAIRIVALQVDELSTHGTEGEVEEVDEAAEQDQTAALIRYALAEATSNVSIAKLLNPDG